MYLTSWFNQAAEFHLCGCGEPRNSPNLPRNLSNFDVENWGPYLSAI